MTVWIFTHGDGDGICASSLALAANPSARLFFTHPYGLLEDLEQTENGDTVIICDIALSQAHLGNLIDKFAEIEDEGFIYYFDHHPLPEDFNVEDIPGNIYHQTGSSASEIVYTFFKDKIDVLQSRAAIYGAISDYMDNTPTVLSLLKMWDKRAIYLETGILVQSLPLLKREYDFKRDVVKDLSSGKPPSSNERLVKLAIQQARKEEEAIKNIRGEIEVTGKVAYVLDFSFPLGKAAIYARALTGTLVGVAGETRGKIIDMSIRAVGEFIDLNMILRKVAPKLGGSGGGHPLAAGARIPKENFYKLISKINESIEEIDF